MPFPHGKVNGKMANGKWILTTAAGALIVSLRDMQPAKAEGWRGFHPEKGFATISIGSIG